MSEYILETRNLIMRFGGLVATNNVSINCRKNEIVGLIGMVAPYGFGQSDLVD